MRSRLMVFVGALFSGAALGLAWNWPGFKAAYQGFIALFAEPNAPLAGAWTAVVLAFVMGVPRICVP